MAQLYPTNIPEDIPESESRVLELIAEDLDDDYSAFWSVKTVGRFLARPIRAVRAGSHDDTLRWVRLARASADGLPPTDAACH